MAIIRPCHPLGLRPECLGLAFPFLNSRKLCHTHSIYEESYSRFPQARRTRGTAIWRKTGPTAKPWLNQFFKVHVDSLQARAIPLYAGVV